jgi:hypothetical protein
VGWDLLVTMALISTAVLVMLVVEWAADHRDRTRLEEVERDAVRTTEALTTSMLLWHDVGYAVLLGVAAVGNGAIFDRYLWPLLVSGAIVILHRFSVGEPMGIDSRSPGRTATAFGGLLLGGMAIASLSLAANSDSFDGARWKAASEAVDRGSAPTEVDAGFEWLGTYRPNLHCIWVVPSQLASGQGVEVATLTFHPLLVGPTSRLYVYRVGGPGCPPA